MRRRKQQAAWRARHPDYFAGRRIQARMVLEYRPGPLRLPLHWINFPGTSRNPISGRKALISLGLWADYCIARRNSSCSHIVLIPQQIWLHYPTLPRHPRSNPVQN
jgi:hypothetical protein